MSDTPPNKSVLLITSGKGAAVIAALASGPQWELKIITPGEFLAAPTAHLHANELVLVSTNGLDLWQLRDSVHAIVAGNLPCLLLVGDRGLAGCEELTGLRQVRLLPAPWTAPGLNAVLEFCLRQDQASESTIPEGEYLASLVESFRDPLTSVHGHVVLSQDKADENTRALLATALYSTAEIELLLEAINLASGKVRPRPAPIKMDEFSETLLERISKLGRNAEADQVAPGQSTVDHRFLLCAMQLAHVLLDKFGPGGIPHLSIETTDNADQGHSVMFSTEGSGTEGDHAPSMFLLYTLQSVCKTGDLELVIESSRRGVPLSAGVLLNP